MLQQCETCTAEAAIRPEPLKTRDLPPRPWHTVAVDIFYYQQTAFFSLIDLYSRYPVVMRLSSETSAAIITACDQIFMLFGVPSILISDNGPQFRSTEFARQLASWDVQHQPTVPYAPRQNPVERLHQTLKRLMRKSGKVAAMEALKVALKVVRSTVCQSTGKTSGDLFLRGGYRTQLQQLADSPAPNEDDEELDEDVRAQDTRLKQDAVEAHQQRYHAQARSLSPGQRVFVKQPGGATERATVVSATPHDAIITTEAGQQPNRHLDRLQPVPSKAVPAAIAPTSTEAETVDGQPRRSARLAAKCHRRSFSK